MKHLWRYIFILVAIIILWNQFILRPIRILSIFFHKIGYSFIAFISGYGQEAFSATFENLGVTMLSVQGWFSSFLVLNGGYISSALFFVIIMGLKKTRVKNYLLGIIAIIYMMFSIINPALQFTWIYIIFFVAIIIILYMIRNNSLDEWVIDIVGISSIVYIMYDTFVDTILLTINQRFNIVSSWRSAPPEYIVKLSEITPLPPLVWAMIWLVISVLLFNMLLIKPSRRSRR
ncbi:M50 family metallopeptidase [Herbivorax sp. ANBcel31]|uniref:M50 family metallopeptidase n=1 Tax=Herbivorax sp. ANBcel31 TaxID=3069754 RepID=UPI0027B3765D|nr:M50 family metallopeptidase [Herbivorax sp. ANBcel31]MDQ2085944.1 M50 family metallopeptidase [Herbivorax sp. ANBcel31]